MRCSKGYVITGASEPVIYTCVNKDSKNVYVTLEGVIGETWPFQGYVKFKLQREADNADGWIDVSTYYGGYWGNSTSTKKHFRFSNIGYIGKVMLVTAEFYTNSNYTSKLKSSASHMFVR